MHMSKRALLILTLIFSNFVLAQNNFYIVTLNHAAISLKDLDRSADFYKNVIHLK